MNTGWVKLFRSLRDWEWWFENDTFKLFIYCLITANHDEQRQCGITIPRGSFITSRKKLSDEVGITEQSVRTSMARLTRTKEITVQSTNQHTIITVCNYDKYQSRDVMEQPASNQRINQRINQRPTSDDVAETQKSTIKATKQVDCVTDCMYDICMYEETSGQPTNQPATNQPSVGDEEKINQQINQQINHKQEIYKNIIRREENNNISSSSPARAREEELALGGVIGEVEKLAEELKQEIRDGGSMFESAMRLYGLNSQQQVEYLGWFVDKLRMEGTSFKSRSDFRRHFANWLRIQVEQSLKRQQHGNAKYSARSENAADLFAELG